MKVKWRQRGTACQRAEIESLIQRLRNPQHGPHYGGFIKGAGFRLHERNVYRRFGKRLTAIANFRVLGPRSASHLSTSSHAGRAGGQQSLMDVDDSTGKAWGWRAAVSALQLRLRWRFCTIRRWPNAVIVAN